MNYEVKYDLFRARPVWTDKVWLSKCKQKGIEVFSLVQSGLEFYWREILKP